MLKPSRRQVDHEDVVAEGYAALRRAALYLARGDEAEAGDLLHDTFVRFLLLRPRLDAIGNLDGYLYTMLRNVYLSRQRRHVRRRAVVTDAIEVELLAVMVDVPEADERLQMRDDLIRLVDHARERSRVSRAASAWILRCVHGYYPAEIARLMKMPPRGVDRALHVARREALAELRRPTRRRDGDGRDGRGAGAGARAAGHSVGGFPGNQRWRDLHLDPRGDASIGAADGEPLDALQALRMRLFASVDGACLTDAAIAELYRPSARADAAAMSGGNARSDLHSSSRTGSESDIDLGGTRRDSEFHADSVFPSRQISGSGSGSDSRFEEAEAPVGTLLMAHVVACAGCLDRINQHLNLPPLKTRDPVESIGTRQRRGSERGGAPGSGADAGARPDAGGDVGRPSGSGSPGPSGETKGGTTNRGGVGLDPLMRRTRDTLASIVDHIPRELRIAANGLELGALPVAGVVTVQELAVRLAESLAFVEIFDERGELVCYWPSRVPNDGALDDDITIDLPDGRSIDLRVSLMDDCPRLRGRYTDARLSADAAAGIQVRRHTRVRDTIAGCESISDRDSIGARDSNGIGAKTAGVDPEADPGLGLRAGEPRGSAHPAWATPEDRQREEPRPSPRHASVEAAGRPRWWQRLIPSPRLAIVGGLLVMLWMLLIGPTTTWAALGHLGRAAVEAIRSLLTPPRPATPTTKAPAAPVGPATSSSPAPLVSPRAGSAARVFSPSELSDLEMTVRVALHDARADLGEDLTLRASSAGVAVLGIVDAPARRDAIAAALADLDGARVDVRTADEVSARGRVSRARRSAGARPSTGAPVIAATTTTTTTTTTAANAIHEALAARIPAPAERAAFVNDTLARADDALARAWALRRLAERYQPRDITGLSARSSRSLATLVDDHTAALRTAVDALITRVTPLVVPAEKAEPPGSVGPDVIREGTNPPGTSRDTRLSVIELFTLVNAWHADAHALMAGARAFPITPAPSASAGDPDASSPDAPGAPSAPGAADSPDVREWLNRLLHIQDALQHPDFGPSTFTR